MVLVLSIEATIYKISHAFIMGTIRSSSCHRNRIDNRKSTAGSNVRHLLLELFFVVALLQVSSIITVQLCGAFGVVSRRKTHTSMGRLYSRLDGDGVDNNNDLLLEKARALRAEASVMENDLRSSGSASSLDISSPQMAVPVVVFNTQLEDSIWTLSYRFSSQPIPKDDTNNNNNQEQQQKNIFYSGKINLRLKEDGYSEQMIIRNEEETSSSDDIEIIKIWGWDRETSSEDDLDYLLFSMDVKLPESDPTTKSNSNSKKNQIERYYFQARIDTEQENNKSVLVLKDGTITVKRDVTEKTNGRWGLFNVAGILTEFRYCGEFVAKPSSS
jgi:hypothetical protein